MNKRLPVNVYQEMYRLMVTAPVPGMEPQNIRVAVRKQRLSIETDRRGPGQERKQQYVRQEWTAGPYRRTIALPVAVDATLANVTFDNGVLVVMLPIATRPRSDAVTLPKVGTAKGRLVRHVGLPPRPR